MKGIGKRVTVGFLSIVILLLISGMISLFELSNLSYNTKAILEAGSEDMEIAKRLLRDSHDHSRAVMDITIFNDNTKFTKRNDAMNSIIDQLRQVNNETNASLNACIDTLKLYAGDMKSIANSYSPSGVLISQDQRMSPRRLAGREWYEIVYEPTYEKFVEQTKRYMKLSHGQLAPNAELLARDARRAITPVLISLLVMIAIVLMLFYFIYLYGVKPIKKINKALSDHLSFKLPFVVKSQLIDEIKELHDNIETLTTSSKSEK